MLEVVCRVVTDGPRPPNFDGASIGAVRGRRRAGVANPALFPIRAVIADGAPCPPRASGGGVHKALPRCQRFQPGRNLGMRCKQDPTFLDLRQKDED